MKTTSRKMLPPMPGVSAESATVCLSSRSVVLVMSTLLLATTGCQIRKPIIKVHDVRLNSVGTRKLGLDFDFRVFNTNLFDANLKSFEYTVVVSGVEFVRGEKPEPVGKFKALDWTAVRMPATVELSRLAEVIRRAKRSDRLECELKGRAVFTVIGFEVPVELNGKITLRRPRAPKWKLVRVRMPRKLTDPIRVVFRVTNPNEFSLPMSALVGKVTVRGQEIVRIEQPSADPIAPRTSRELTFAVKMKLRNLDRAVLKSLLAGENVEFDGDFSLDPPISLRERASKSVQQEK